MHTGRIVTAVRDKKAAKRTQSAHHVLAKRNSREVLFSRVYIALAINDTDQQQYFVETVLIPID